MLGYRHVYVAVVYVDPHAECLMLLAENVTYTLNVFHNILSFILSFANYVCCVFEPVSPDLFCLVVMFTLVSLLNFVFSRLL